jgi:NAD+-dependent protein deacetylase sirtuin 1
MNLESYLSITLSKTSKLDEILNDYKQNELPTSSSNTSRSSFSESIINSSTDDSTIDDSSSPHKKLKTSHDGYDDTDNEEESNEEDEEDKVSDDLRHWIKSTHGTNPRALLTHIIPSYVQIPDDLDDYDIFKILNHLINDDSSQIQRIKLPNINTLDQTIDLIRNSKNIIVLTGAGCSVSCGIPDFRSRNGIYARLSKDFPDLPDPQSMFDIYYFKHDPRPFFKFAKEIYPGQFEPSLSHKFIKKIEENNKLLRNYTQNIDTLELAADIKRVIQCHGSFATASCTSCMRKLNADDIKEKIFNQEIPKCDQCNNENAIIKPDIVFFGENLPEEYHKSILDDKNVCDLLIVIGSSLKVRPVANIPSN